MEYQVRLLLSRHGQTEWHHSNRYAGRSDVKLTEIGYLQAQALAQRAQREQPAVVACSPLSRAIRTARPVAEACGVELLVEERLREVDFGEWEGRTLAEIRKTDSIAVERFEINPVEHGFPGGEPLLDAAQRALEVFWELGEMYQGQTVIVVAHNTIIRLSICLLLGVPLKDYRRRLPRLINAGISEVRLNTEGGALYTLNDSKHLHLLTNPAYDL